MRQLIEQFKRKFKENGVATSLAHFNGSELTRNGKVNRQTTTRITCRSFALYTIHDALWRSDPPSRDSELLLPTAGAEHRRMWHLGPAELAELRIGRVACLG